MRAAEAKNEAFDTDMTRFSAVVRSELPRLRTAFSPMQPVGGLTWNGAYGTQRNDRWDHKNQY
jgi:hypothetical protein